MKTIRKIEAINHIRFLLESYIQLWWMPRFLGQTVDLRYQNIRHGKKLLAEKVYYFGLFFPKKIQLVEGYPIHYSNSRGLGVCYPGR